MDLSRPYSVLCPSLDGDVLATLARTRRPLSGREVARLAGRRSHAGVRTVLVRLVEQGLVVQVEATPALLYTLNRDHVAAPAVEILAGLRGEIVRRIQLSIAGWVIPPVAAAMFGSAARGDGDTRSDIDLFVVRPTHLGDEDPMWRGQIEDLAVRIQRWTGNRAGIAEVSKMEIPRLREEQPQIVKNVRADAVMLYGEDIEDLLGGPS